MKVIGVQENLDKIIQKPKRLNDTLKEIFFSKKSIWLMIAVIVLVGVEFFFNMMDMVGVSMTSIPFNTKFYLVNNLLLIGAVFLIGNMMKRLKESNEKLRKNHMTNDIKQKRIEEALTESEKRLRQITDNMLDLIHQINHQGIIEYISPSCIKILGYEPKDMIGKYIFDFIHPDDLDKVMDICDYAIKTGMGDIAEYRYRHINGNYVWIESVGKPVFNEDDEFIGATIAGRDITQRKNAEKELRESKEQYKRLVEHSPDAIAIYKNGKFLFANKAAAKLVGLKDPKELIGKSIFDYLHPDFHEKTLERLRRVEEKNIPTYFVEEKIIRNDNKVVDIEKVAIPFPHKGGIAVQIIARDITDRKRAEENERLLREAKKYDELRNEFFANISHELRTPLNVILGTLQLLDIHLKDTCNNHLNKYKDIMKQNCNRLLRLVNNLIDITKIDTGFFEIKLKNVNIVSLIEDITLSVADYIENKGIVLQFDTEMEEKLMACDPDKIERIILNLLSNAVKFTDVGGNIKVTIYDRDEYICISVKDTGIGIPKEQIGAVFERFRQVDKSLARNHEGSGIGLSLVKSFVEMHNGKIYLESEYGEGSEFIIELPVRVLQQENNEFENTHSVQWGYIERIQVEFSDIYSKK
ncbi:PAS domain-containing sensor histidine kinase [Crassaminicella thermophila]|uniref:histidine kinase n=1 Tax=Crassaminicella thermophila TaxID=2599308 RepID=A0A5C0SDJ5_CRATE|nr:PAS domain-containing sensor histidine kinase [Crassaminicella thermophila]QEK10999.1 PAS domain-containing sensor histidine kinase [Crassaminicella thermophila]